MSYLAKLSGNANLVPTASPQKRVIARSSGLLAGQKKQKKKFDHFGGTGGDFSPTGECS